MVHLQARSRQRAQVDFHQPSLGTESSWAPKAQTSEQSVQAQLEIELFPGVPGVPILCFSATGIQLDL